MTVFIMQAMQKKKKEKKRRDLDGFGGQWGGLF